MGIIGSRTLRASDIRYMNDSTELIYALNLLRETISTRTHPSNLLQNAFGVSWLKAGI